MPPSASNFLNQNQFLTQSTISSPHVPLQQQDLFHHDEPPLLHQRAYVDPRFLFQTQNMPNNQSYHGPPPPIPPCPSTIRSPFSSSHNQEHIMTSPKTLPSVAHIPLLIGRADFGA
jgi:hypothetical protein